MLHDIPTAFMMVAQNKYQESFLFHEIIFVMGMIPFTDYIGETLMWASQSDPERLLRDLKY